MDLNLLSRLKHRMSKAAPEVAETGVYYNFLIFPAEIRILVYNDLEALDRFVLSQTCRQLHQEVPLPWTGQLDHQSLSSADRKDLLIRFRVDKFLHLENSLRHTSDRSKALCFGCLAIHPLKAFQANTLKRHPRERYRKSYGVIWLCPHYCATREGLKDLKDLLASVNNPYVFDYSHSCRTRSRGQSWGFYTLEHLEFGSRLLSKDVVLEVSYMYFFSTTGYETGPLLMDTILLQCMQSAARFRMTFCPHMTYTDARTRALLRDLCVHAVQHRHDRYETLDKTIDSITCKEKHCRTTVSGSCTRERFRVLVKRNLGDLEAVNPFGDNVGLAQISPPPSPGEQQEITTWSSDGLYASGYFRSLVWIPCSRDRDLQWQL